MKNFTESEASQGAVALMTWLVVHLLQAPGASLKVLYLSGNKLIPAEAWRLVASADGTPCVCETLRLKGELNLCGCFIGEANGGDAVSYGPGDPRPPLR
mmetsp:Transcript_53682/g.127902  ORF Transcript_53682/g.127902 Transcript_53682/m.127902 type:complete len:99 (-) Transcript_53682:3-299(-)